MRKGSSSFCVRCGARDFTGFVARCPHCNGLIEIAHSRQARVRDAESNPLRRYAEFLPIADLDAAVWVGAGEPTPCRHARTLGDAIGHPRVWLKDETACPSRTTKDRMGSVVLSYFRELGVRSFHASSTGNSSTSLALAAAHTPEIEAHLFCGESFLYAMNWPDLPNVQLRVLRGATFVEAFELARKLGATANSISERGFFNPARREGLKLTFFEAAEQVPAPIDWYFQAVSSGMGVYGTWKGARELLDAGVIQRLPRLCCVQQESCSPQVAAFREGAMEMSERHVVARPTGIARAILRGDARQVYPYLRAIVVESGGTFVAVSEREILAAQELLSQSEGISACAAAACTLAGLRRLIADGVVSGSEAVLLNITGGDRPPIATSRYTWLTRSGDDWTEESAAGRSSR